MNAGPYPVQRVSFLPPNAKWREGTGQLNQPIGALALAFAVLLLWPGWSCSAGWVPVCSWGNALEGLGSCRRCSGSQLGYHIQCLVAVRQSAPYYARGANSAGLPISATGCCLSPQNRPVLRLHRLSRKTKLFFLSWCFLLWCPDCYSLPASLAQWHPGPSQISLALDFGGTEAAVSICSSLKMPGFLRSLIHSLLTAFREGGQPFPGENIKAGFIFA